MLHELQGLCCMGCHGYVALYNTYEDKVCPLCTIHMDTQTHSVQCVQVKESVSVNGNYIDIFKEVIPRNISKTLYDISKLREGII